MKVFWPSAFEVQPTVMVATPSAKPRFREKLGVWNLNWPRKPQLPRNKTRSIQDQPTETTLFNSYIWHPPLSHHHTTHFISPQEMAYIFSENRPTFSEAEKVNHLRDEHETTNTVTSQLHLKSPAQTSETLDKDVVLRRIRHHKCVNKVRSAFQALVSSASPGQADRVSAYEQKWLEQDDAFSAP